MAPALVLSLWLPDRYMAEALILATAGPNTPASPDQINELTKRAFSNDRLVKVIQTYDLYHDGASRLGTPLNANIFGLYPRSMDEAADQVRQAIRMERVRANGTLSLFFNSTKPALAAQITNQLLALMVEDNLRNTPNSSASVAPLKLVILYPAMIPQEPYRPNRPPMI